jgi:hypothetical protein
VKVCDVNGVESVAVNVPSVVVVLLKVSVIVTVLFTVVVGVLKVKLALPDAELFGVLKDVASQVAVAVFVAVVLYAGCDE